MTWWNYPCRVGFGEHHPLVLAELSNDTYYSDRNSWKGLTVDLANVDIYLTNWTQPQESSFTSHITHDNYLRDGTERLTIHVGSHRRTWYWMDLDTEYHDGDILTVEKLKLALPAWVQFAEGADVIQRSAHRLELDKQPKYPKDK